MVNVIVPDTSAVSQKQELCPGLLTLEILNDGKIAVFNFNARTKDAVMNTREVADVWVQAFKQQIEPLAAGDSWYRMHDFSQMNIPPTPYFVAKLVEVSKQRPDLRGHSVFILPRNMFTQLMQNLSYRIKPHHIKIRLFFSREQGLRWMQNEIASAKGNIGSLGLVSLENDTSKA